MESLTMASPRSPIGKNVKFVEEKQLKLLLIGMNTKKCITITVFSPLKYPLLIIVYLLINVRVCREKISILIKFFHQLIPFYRNTYLF